VTVGGGVVNSDELRGWAKARPRWVRYRVLTAVGSGSAGSHGFSGSFVSSSDAKANLFCFGFLI